jgi:hypothetical protein
VKAGAFGFDANGSPVDGPVVVVIDNGRACATPQYLRAMRVIEADVEDPRAVEYQAERDRDAAEWRQLAARINAEAAR